MAHTGGAGCTPSEVVLHFRSCVTERVTATCQDVVQQHTRHLYKGEHVTISNTLSTCYSNTSTACTSTEYSVAGVSTSVTSHSVEWHWTDL